MFLFFWVLHLLGTDDGCSFLNSETKYASLTRAESGNQNDALSNGAANSRTETGNHPAPIKNGIANAFGPSTGKMSQMVPATVSSNNDLQKKSTLAGDRDNKTKS